MYKGLLGIALSLLCFPAWASCPSATTTPKTMAIISPCVSNLDGTQFVISYNQVLAPHMTNVPVTDANMIVGPLLQAVVHAPGALNVEIRTHGTLACRMTIGPLGWTCPLDLSKEWHGPIRMDVDAWDSAPGNNNFTWHTSASFIVYVESGKWRPLPTPPAGVTVSQTPRFLERFGNSSGGPATLDMASCAKGTGVWPNCQPPTSADATWYENKPEFGSDNHGGFQSAAFEHADGPYNPFYIPDAAKGGGWWRIRATYDPNYVDPYGFNRHWRSGLVSTAFPDASQRVNMGNGYYSARILIPKASTAYQTATNAGGTGPAFWMLLRPEIAANTGYNCEIDTMEANGPFPTYYSSGEIVYGTATPPGGHTIFHAQPQPITDLTWDPHEWGVNITDTSVTGYFDGKPMGSVPTCQLPGGAKRSWFMMLNLAMGFGWPLTPPPSNYFDMLLDYAAYWPAPGA